MRDDLLYFYERELAYLRRTGTEFGQRYPKVASRLLLEPTKCDDPHVERILEGFAFLAARVQLKLEDDFPEFSESLLEVLYPHHTRPIPSMSLVEMKLDPEQGKLAGGLPVPRDTILHSRSVGGVVCRFRTCYDSLLWPIRVTTARWTTPFELNPPVRAPGAVGAIRMLLEAPADLGFSALKLDSLRLHLSAEPGLASTLYELLCNNCTEILLRDPDDAGAREPISLPPSALKPVGFARSEGILPETPRSFVGYRLLQEYFSLPEKFYFLDLTGMDRVRAAGFGPRMEVIFLISSFERADRRSMLEAGVTGDTIRLNCTPIVNLFPQTSEPILLDHKRFEYPVLTDSRGRKGGASVFSIEEVVAVTPGTDEIVRYNPFYSLRHDHVQGNESFWHARRQPVNWRPEEGTDVYLSFVDLSGKTSEPDAAAVTARLLCFNGDLPSRLPFGNAQGDFEMPVGGPVRQIIALVKPTQVVHPALGKAQLWRLISQLSLSYTSLVAGGAEALRELLRLHNVADHPAGERQIQGIRQVQGRARHARIESEHGLTFARGHAVEMEIDEEQFAGGSVYVLATVLHRFLGLAVSLNSFTSLTVRTRQRKRPVAEFPPISGWKTLL